MPIDDQAIAELRKQFAFQAQNYSTIVITHKDADALLTAASNEARLRRLYDGQQDLIEDQARKLHTAQMEAEALRARDAGWALENEELKEALSDLLTDYRETWIGEGASNWVFDKLGSVVKARAALTPPAASEEDAS